MRVRVDGLSRGKGVVVAFSGPDGSGKTTQSRLLMLLLKHRGFRVVKVWIRANHTLAYFLTKLTSSLSPGSVVRVDGGSVVTHRLATGPLGSLIWPWVEFLGVLPHLVFKVFIPSLLGCVVVADRYLPDTVVSVCLAVGFKNPFRHLALRVMLGLARGAKLVFLDASYREIAGRRERPDPRWFVRAQKRLYGLLAKAFSAPIVDTTGKSKWATFREVVRVLGL